MRNAPLADALSLCLIQRHDDENYMRFAVRWHSRAVTELGFTSLHESTIMLTALASLTTADAPAGLATLRRVFEEHGRRDLLKALDAQCPADNARPTAH